MNDFGPAFPGSSASEIPPMVDPSRLRPQPPETVQSQGDDPRVSQPIPFRRPENEQASSSGGVAVADPEVGVTFSTQRANSQIMVNDGETAVIGGLTVQDVNQLLKQFREMKKMMKTMSKLMGKGRSVDLGALMGGR